MAKYTAEQIKKWEIFASKDGSPYKPARPLNHQLDGFINRLKLAWAVFTGKHDVLDWEENGS